jgi:2-polyprenyl-3-methyl-5-hydroxy-6-metoxy-1,4-benzoquinol methylase
MAAMTKRPRKAFAGGAQRGYQESFSDIIPSMYCAKGRIRKAETMLRVLADYYGAAHLQKLNVLDVGASTGIIDHHLSQRVAMVRGIDIDTKALAYAAQEFQRPNLHFEHGDAMALACDDNQFDVVICSQMYEHVPCAQTLMREIYRVLKPGGVCYFSAGNRLQWREPHYGLPLLSVIPKALAHPYMRLARKGEQYYETHFSYWGLSRLTRSYERIDYTKKLVDSPNVFATDYMLPVGSAKQRIANALLRYAYWLFPNYIWLLRKSEG